MTIKGGEIAGKIIDRLKARPAPRKFLAAVLVGDDPASLNFLGRKREIAGELAVDFRVYEFPASIKNDDLRREVGKITNHKTCGGAIVQLPLPAHLDKHCILNVIPQEKDVDVLGERALGAFYAGRGPVLPPAVGTVEEILSNAGCQTSSVKAAVVGAGFLVGRPVALWLMNKVRELGIFEKGSDLTRLKNYDLVVSGAGQPALIKPETLKDGAGVIDFGCFIGKDGKIRGDLDESRLPESGGRLSFYTLTPGGTGPILVAKLFENFYKLNGL